MVNLNSKSLPFGFYKKGHCSDKPNYMPNLQIKLKKLHHVTHYISLNIHDTIIIMKVLVFTTYGLLMRACFQNVIRINSYNQDICIIEKNLFFFTS
jgi:hypothetical protein